MISFKKINPTCSNIYLIDQNLCLKNSLNLINFNFSRLYSSVAYLSSFKNNWYPIYTTFSENSAKWIVASSNFQTFSAKWLDMATTVSSLSSQWTKKWTIFYPEMISITTPNLQQTIENKAISWMNIYFPTSNYNKNQLVDVFFHVSQEGSFTFNFNRSYRETCIPTGGGLVLSCSGCSRPHHGCNHTSGSGKNKRHWCTNAYDGCGVTVSSASANATCTGTGGKLLQIGLNRAGSDRNVARIISAKLKNINNSWSVI
jgi:hypothetical protein